QNSKMSSSGLYVANHLLQFIEANMESQQQKLVEVTSALVMKVTQKPAFSTVLLAWLYDKRGDAYVALKEYQRAIQDYDRAIELDSTSTWAYDRRGDAYVALKE